MSRKEYKLPNGKIAVFEYDVCGIGKITLECMGELMDMITDRPQGEWIKTTPWSYGGGMGEVYGYYQKCSNCGKEFMDKSNFCPNCGARMKGADDES